MGVLLIVGTAKGAALLRSDASRQSWEVDALRMKGWAVTAATRDARGRFYVAVTGDVFGAAILTSDDGKSWAQLENAPRYKSTDVGNDEHNRIAKASDFLNRIKPGSRYVDQIWKLHTHDDVVYAGSRRRASSEATTAASPGRSCRGSTSIRTDPVGCPVSGACAPTRF